MSNAGWKGPNEPWDQHSRPLARAALNSARKAGWWLKKSSGGAKVWGVITCGNPALPPAERCSTSVLSTSGSPDGSGTAQHIHNLVRCCTHERTPHGEVDALVAAEALVAAARLCLEAANSLIDASAHRDLVEDYLVQSEAAAREADELLGQALAEEQLADVADAAASMAAATAGTSVKLGIRGLAERARDQTDEANGLVADGAGRRARLLKDQCNDIRNHVRALMARLQ